MGTKKARRLGEEQNTESLDGIISRLEKEKVVNKEQRGEVVFYHHRNKYGFCRAGGEDHFFNSKIIDGFVKVGDQLIFESENKRIHKARRVNDEKVKG